MLLKKINEKDINMIFEFPENWSKLDLITKSVILEEYEDCLREEGCSERDIKLQLEMVKYELE